MNWIRIAKGERPHPPSLPMEADAQPGLRAAVDNPRARNPLLSLPQSGAAWELEERSPDSCSSTRSSAEH